MKTYTVSSRFVACIKRRLAMARRQSKAATLFGRPWHYWCGREDSLNDVLGFFRNELEGKWPEKTAK